MEKEDYLRIFKDKGYCLIKQYDISFYSKKVVKAHELLIAELEQDLSTNYTLEKFQFTIGEDILCSDTYFCFSDKSKAEVEIVKNLETFIARILNANDQIQSTTTENNKNAYTYYRGHSDWKYPLKPSIYREENKNILENEDKIYRDILSSKPHFFNDCNTTLEKLVKMQHHGIPTRLLDLTDNPLIALFFACKSSDLKKHGEVLLFKVSEDKFKYYDSDTVSVLANLVKCRYEFDISGYVDFYRDIEGMKVANFKSIASKEKEVHDKYISQRIAEFNQIKAVSELIHFIREDKPYFLDKISPYHLKNHTLVVKPKMVIDRIINQSGAFVLFGINNKKSVCSDFNINEKDFKQKVFIVPSDYKGKILKDLSLLNINESTVFGDMDSTAKFFKDKYK